MPNDLRIYARVARPEPKVREHYHPEYFSATESANFKAIILWGLGAFYAWQRPVRQGFSEKSANNLCKLFTLHNLLVFAELTRFFYRIGLGRDLKQSQ